MKVVVEDRTRLGSRKAVALVLITIAVIGVRRGAEQSTFTDSKSQVNMLDLC